jgi:hypothetical protein
MTRTDSLITGAIKAIKSARRGSAKTQHNHIQEAKRFTETLRELGYGVRQWKNISNKHVGAVVNSWKAKGLATATMKEYLAGVRVVAAFFKNDRIAKENSAFGIGKRVYVSNRDKSVPQAVYERVVAKTEREWEQRFYRTLHRHGLTKSACGASSHGLRHAYAQERYAQITGFEPSVKFDSQEAFRENAERIAGEEWKKLDSDAREVLKAELGHGRDRMDVISQYIGRS